MRRSLRLLLDFVGAEFILPAWFGRLGKLPSLHGERGKSSLLLGSLCVLLLLIIAPLSSRADDEYPTLAEFAANPVPVADPLRLAAELRGVTDIPTTPNSVPVRQIGEREDFWVEDEANDTSSQINAELRAISDHLYMWVQVGETVADASLQALAHDFDVQVYDQVRMLWGTEPSPGIDGDPRLYVLFTPEVSRYALAYYTHRHTFPRAVYPHSNQHEMFVVNLGAVSPDDFTSGALVSTLAHEFQHMIRAKSQANDATFVNEGFSTFTQGYLFNDFGIGIYYLIAPNTQLNAWAEDGSKRSANYGAALLFLDYFAGRYGMEALRRVSDDPGLGMDAFDHVLKAMGEQGVDSFFADWVMATGINDPSAADGRYVYPNLPDLGKPHFKSSLLPDQVMAGEVPQYASDYYALLGLNGRDSVTVTLDAAETVGLIPTQPTSGSWMWYSQRGDDSVMTLTRAFDLTGLNHATLDYRLWYYLEYLWDYGYLMVSDDGGATWDILPTPDTTTENPHHNAYGAGYTGQTTGWLDERVSLDAYAGRPILVRFSVITDDAMNQPGVALDDIRLPELGYSSDFETDGGGWESAGWIRTDNRLPQQVWVQAAQTAGDMTTVTRWLAAGRGEWTLDLLPGVTDAVLSVSPFAPMTTVTLPYMLVVK